MVSFLISTAVPETEKQKTKKRRKEQNETNFMVI